VAACKEVGALITLEDLANWKVYLEEPVKATYHGIEVYKLNTWVQGPVMLQALNMLENFDLKALGYNSAEYIHLLYQVMNLAFADRDFYYGDPYLPPQEPLQGLLSKEYARDRIKLINWQANDPDVKPGDPYPYEGKTNPYKHYLENGVTETGRLKKNETWPGWKKVSFKVQLLLKRPMRKAGWFHSPRAEPGFPASLPGKRALP